FQGIEGYDEIRPGYTKVAEWNGGELDDYEIQTGDYGMDFERESLNVENIPADSARITEEVVAGERDDEFADAVELNAAFRIYARDDVSTLEDGLDEARAAIEDGSAKAVLEELRDV
ncbi:MAG: anthranilate phosphoribosyltransferase, partial [Halobacteria archaeon]|nr:anthranilate phosphoribosyltransferase [Halobacteria archaeon]